MKAGGAYDRRFVAPNPSTTNPDWAEIEAEGDAGRSEALGVAGAAIRVFPQVGQNSPYIRHVVNCGQQDLPRS